MNKPTANKTNRFAMPETWNDRLSVLIIGCGGTGSEMLDCLMRLHHVMVHRGHPTGLIITLADGDHVETPNVGRQRFLPADVGSNKAETLARRYGMLYGTNIHAHPRHCKKSDFDQICRNYDLIITCVDSAKFRTAFAKFAAKQVRSKALWLDLGNGSHEGQAVLGHVNPKAPNRLPHTLDLFPETATVKDDAEPSCSLEAALLSQRLGINRLLVDAAVFSVLAPLITTGLVEIHGAFVNLEKASVRPLKIDPDSWAFLGYQTQKAA